MKTPARKLNFISSSGIRKFFEMERAYGDVLSLATGEPDYATPKHIAEAGVEALRSGYTHYTSNLGLQELRQAIANKLQRENDVEYSPEEIMITSGSSEALIDTLLSTLDPGDEVMLFDPCYVAYEPCVRLAGGSPVHVPTYEEDDWNPNPELIKKKIAPRTKVILLSSPSNPTGAVLSKDTLETIAEIAQKQDIFIVSDEVYEKIVYDGIRNYSIASFSNMKERTYTINGFSKAYAMTGWRIGYVACPKALMDSLLKVHQNSALCAPAMAQKAACVALTGPQGCVREMVEEYARRRDLIISEINKIDGFSCRKPKGAFYAFANVKELLARKGDAIREYLKERIEVPVSLSEQFMDYIFQSAHVVVVAGSFFGMEGEGYVRMTYAKSSQEIREAFQRINEAVSNI